MRHSCSEAATEVAPDGFVCRSPPPLDSDFTANISAPRGCPQLRIGWRDGERGCRTHSPSGRQKPGWALVPLAKLGRSGQQPAGSLDSSRPALTRDPAVPALYQGLLQGPRFQTLAAGLCVCRALEEELCVVAVKDFPSGTSSQFWAGGGSQFPQWILCAAGEAPRPALSASPGRSGC